MKVLICPLNWGLGHATRCIPLIDQYIQQGHIVHIATDGIALKLLQERYPQLRFWHAPSYSIRYSKGTSQVAKLLFQLPGIVKSIFQEHSWLKKHVNAESYDLILSDNRFGMWHSTIKSVYITHQLQIKMPDGIKFLEPIAWWLHRQIIKQYAECWIPDFSGTNNLSGELSHGKPLLPNTVYIGPLSRFSFLKASPSVNVFDAVCIVSGPEPQRTLFETQLLRRFSNYSGKVLLLRGLPGSKNTLNHTENIHVKNSLNDVDLAGYLLSCNKIICRSGYSTIMDLYTLNCLHKAEMIATPGQTEQQYLQKLYLHKYSVQNRHTVDLK